MNVIKHNATIHQDKNNIYYQILLGLIFSVGIGLRIERILHTSTLSFDEAWSWWLGSQNLTKLLFIAATDKHPPLFYLFMHFWNMLFKSELWLRLPSLIASIANLWIFYKLSVYILKNRYFVLFALILFAIDPMQLWYTSVARSYMPGTTFVMLSTWSFFLFIDQQGKKWLIYNFIFNVIVILLNYIGILMVLIQFFVFYILYLQNTVSGQSFRFWLKLNAGILILLLILLPYAVNQVLVGGFAPKWIASMEGVPGLSALLSQMSVLNYNLFNITESAWRTTLQIGVFFIFFISSVYLFRKKGISPFISSPFLLLFLLAFSPIVLFWIISKFEPVFVSRYFMMFYFAYYLLLSFLLLKANYPRIIITILTVGLVSGFAAPTYKHFSKKNIWETNWEKQSAIIDKNWQDGDVLLVLPIADLVRVKFYLNDFKNKIDKNLYRQMFKSKTKAVTTAELDSLFDHWNFPYRRIWFHDEIKTGLAAEFFLAPENFVFKYLNTRFKADSTLQYTDAHGRLRLYYIRLNRSVKEQVR